MACAVDGGHAFYVYNSAKLNLLFASRQIAEEITVIKAGANDNLVYTALKETNMI